MNDLKQSFISAYRPELDKYLGFYYAVFIANAAIPREYKLCHVVVSYDEKGDYYCWYAKKEDKYMIKFVSPFELAIESYFPQGIRLATKKGLGIFGRCSVTKIRDVDRKTEELCFREGEYHT